MGSKCFCGEVWTNVHPDIMSVVSSVNSIAVDGKVGNDKYSKHTCELIRSFFNNEVYTTFAFNGTAANILALKAMLKPWGTVISAECTHVNTYECGAAESLLGTKILTVATDDGKLSPAILDEYFTGIRNFKYNPQVIVITQPTELGVLYTCKELSALTSYAHSNNMLVYLDGARITNALAALDVSLSAMVEDTGIDAFSFGGTKAGLMFGELVVFRQAQFAENIAYLQKQSLQHMDKSKFIGAQFEYLLESGLWKRTAEHSNKMAKLLEQKLSEKGVTPFYAVDTNMVFCKLTDAQFKRVTSVYDLHFWDESRNIIRFATTFETTEEMIDNLVSII